MPRISGIDLPDNKPAWIALTYLYGIGRKNVGKLLKDANIEPTKKAKDLNPEEMNRITKALDNYTVEGDLRKEISENIKRLKEIVSYRGVRHGKSLPVRGQRTRSNARTKRGKRLTIGAMKKEALAGKTDSASKAPAAAGKTK
jgi:small subunit ribosomal protein S13